ncbi:MAG: bifunctional 3'-5' exonuclease/DNA polymerase [Nakamurella sp.]
MSRRPERLPGYQLHEITESGDFVGPRVVVETVAGLADWATRGQRWLWDSAASIYPPLVSAGVRIERSYDIALSERILLSREGRFGAPVLAAAVRARALGEAVPDDRVDLPGPPALFDAGSTRHAGQPDLDLIDVLRCAFVDQRRRCAGDRALALLLAAESASGLAAVEMGVIGLPWRVDIHLDLLTDLLGPRPPAGHRPVRLAQLSGEIDDAFGFPVNPDSAIDLRAAFRRAGFDIESTRSWLLKELDHPAVRPVLRYKELARVHTANGWNWLDEWARGGRFHPEYLPGAVVSGRWATRGGGALQIPRGLRKAVVADSGHRLVVADAAQLEPRVLAAISADAALQRVSADADLYTALADDGFGGDRAHAKVAMLGAMYGATSGESGRLLGTLRRRYPVAMAYVESAAREGERGGVVRTVLGRACPPPSAGWRAAVEIGTQQDATDAERRRADQFARDRGRFTRNFVVQGSAADWASVWLSGLRRDLHSVPGAELVFFQHDELIVQVPTDSARQVAELTVAAADSARRLAFPMSLVTTPVLPKIVDCYADAK